MNIVIPVGGSGGRKIKTGTKAGNDSFVMTFTGLDFEPVDFEIVIAAVAYNSPAPSAIWALGRKSGTVYGVRGNSSAAYGIGITSAVYSSGTFTVTVQSAGSINFSSSYQYFYILLGAE